MENASKALLIAAAILITLLIISLGIYFYTQAQGMAKDGGGAQIEIQTFNSKFTKYEGDISGIQVRNLIQEIRASNATNTDHIVKIGENKEGSSLPGNSASYDTKKTYSVSIVEYDSDGYASIIKITDKNQSETPSGN